MSDRPEATGELGPVVVMKFGGTSVGEPAGRHAIARRVSAELAEGRAPVVVVSAMGRVGAPYATDTLLGLLGDLPADDRERDLLAATGEVISAVLVAHELRAAGIAATALSGAEAGICTDGVFGKASVTQVHVDALLGVLEGSTVPVVAGFQGLSEDGRVTTLGRGGSDTTACALGVALAAESVDIYTDVDGVMSADPRLQPDAIVLESIRSDELSQMARYGARVVHGPAADLALASGLAVRVRNTFSDHPGTLVVDMSAYTPSAVATAVSHVRDIARVRVGLMAPEGSPAHMHAQAKVYRAMADACVSLDMFTPMRETLEFTVASSALGTVREALAEVGLPHEEVPGLAKVTLVGAGMHGVPGVMARVAECLSEAGVSVLQTADSHTTISVLVAEADVEPAVSALHEGFHLGDAT